MSMPRNTVLFVTAPQFLFTLSTFIALHSENSQQKILTYSTENTN